MELEADDDDNYDENDEEYKQLKKIQKKDITVKKFNIFALFFQVSVFFFF